MFTSNTFTLGRGSYNCEGNSNCIAQHFYTTADSMAEVLGAGYLPTNILSILGADNIQDNDLVIIYSSTSQEWHLCSMTLLETTPNLTQIDLAQTATGFPVSFSGPYTQNMTIGAVKSGRQVTLFMGGLNGTSTSSSFFTSAGAVVPPLFFPAADTEDMRFCSIGSTNANCLVSINSGTGTMTIANLTTGSSGNFPGSGNVAISQGFVSYYTTS
jgi:hypothetical protein